MSEVRPDPFDHARAQVLFNAFERTRRDDAEVLRLELAAVGAVLDPPTFTFDVLTGRHLGDRAYYGDEVALAPGFDAQHAEAALGTMEGDPLDRPGEAIGRGL
jgi:hypothetical protein